MQNEFGENRYANYDLLRCVATLGVIFLHVSSTYKLAITNVNVFGKLSKDNIIYTLAYNTMFRFAVPCFLMLSGALILCKEENRRYKEFYIKSFKKFGIHIFIFSVLYLLYSFIKCIVQIIFLGKNREMLLYPVIDLIKGRPFYHMWYVYMLIGVYALIPIVFYFKESISSEVFVKVVMGFAIVSCLSIWTANYDTNWNVGISFCFLSYVMLGHIIEQQIKKKNNKKAIAFIWGGILLELVVLRIQYCHTIKGISEANENYSLIGPANPLILIAACLIFIGFTFLEIFKNKFIQIISKYSFYIYLFHAAIWDILEQILKVLNIGVTSWLIIPLSSMVTFLISLGLSIIYCRLWEWVKLKWGGVWRNERG